MPVMLLIVGVGTPCEMISVSLLLSEVPSTDTVIVKVPWVSEG